MRMKKFVMLFVFTLIAISGVIIAGIFFKNSIVTVSVVKVEPLTVENAVTCTGRVEHAKTTNVYVKTTSLVKTIYVNVGDQVKAGQPLMSTTTYQNNSTSSASSLTQQAYENYMNGQQSGSPSSSTSETKDEDILAPEAGEVTSITADRLSYAYPSKAVMAIAGNSNLQIRLSVNESQVSDIKVGQKASITGVGFKNAYSGTVKSISSGAKQVDTTAGQDTVIDVIVSVENPNADIKPGFTTKAKIITSTSLET
jgi:multidrug efflux pump subunit AcrA (membrane-fusion protein)